MNKQAYRFEQDKRGINLSYANDKPNIHYHGSPSRIIPEFIFDNYGDNNECR